MQSKKEKITEVFFDAIRSAKRITIEDEDDNVRSYGISFSSQCVFEKARVVYVHPYNFVRFESSNGSKLSFSECSIQNISYDGKKMFCVTIGQYGKLSCIVPSFKLRISVE